MATTVTISAFGSFHLLNVEIVGALDQYSKASVFGRWDLKFPGVLYSPQFTLSNANASLLRLWNEVAKV